MTRTQVIVGDGVAGMSAAHAIRVAAPADRVVVVSDDPQPFYFRASLTNYLMGELSVDELDGLPAHGWSELRVERVSARARGLDPGAHRLELEGRAPIDYDRLLVATGARARRLPTPAQGPDGVPGADLAGVVVLRTFHDAQRVVEAARRARRAVVVGGGILGLEAAQGLVARGLSVTLLHRQPYLLEKVLDRRAADLLRNRLRRAGVDVRLPVAPAAIEGDARGRVRAVTLTDGGTVPAELVLVAVGNVPNTEWLDGSGVELARNGSVPVDVEMRVRGAEDVYAAGDLVDFADPQSPWRNPGGLWQPARKQGRVAGMNMAAGAADAPVEYRPGVLYNATRAWDLDLGSLGGHVDDRGADDARVYDDVRDGVPVYKKAVVRQGRLLGALLVGDRREGHALRRLMNLDGEAADVTAVLDRLFDPDFDLFAYVARQESASARAVWRKTVHLPRGPLPPSLAVRKGATVQRALALGVRPATPLAVGGDGALTLAHGEREDRFDGPTVRVGATRGCDVRVAAPEGGADEELVLSREGAVWSVHSTAGRRARALVNGTPLRGRRPLADRDALELGRWRGVVRLRALVAGRPAGAPVPVAALVGARRTDLLAGRTYTLGAARDNDVVVGGEGVSDHHAQLEVRGDAGACWLKDLGSEAGTFVGDERVTVPRRLAPGDAVRLGGAAGVVFQPAAALGVVGAPPAEPARAPIGATTGAAVVYLVGVEGPLAGRALAVPLGATLGRGSAADVQLDDPLVSKVHARVAGTAAAPVVSDLGSANGTFLGGARLDPDVVRPLREGDELRLGRTRFRFTRQETAGRVGARAPADEEARRPASSGRTTVVLSAASPRLVEELPDRRPLERLLGDPVVRLGRAADNTIVLARTDVSARHAVLTLEHGTYVLEDLGSRFGTRVNHRPVAKGERVRLADGDRLDLASVTLTFVAGGLAAGAARVVRGAVLRPTDHALALALPEITLEGAGPFVLGRKPHERDRDREPGTDVVLPFPTVSRVHARVTRRGEDWLVADLGSANGTTVDGREVGADPVALRPGAVLGFQRAPVAGAERPAVPDVHLRFDLVVEERAPAPASPPAAPPARRRPDSGFAVDGTATAGAGVPLDVIVAEELDACIGCHDCMRACPLEEARTVSIGALNAFADGLATPSGTTVAFAQRCTQCHACVPVCPADLHRSRIVLFNKLKPQAQPSPDAPVVFQVGADKVESRWTLAMASAALAASPLLAPLLEEQRRRLLAAARWRRLARRETLLAEGAYADALWVVVEGRLALCADLGGGRVEPLTSLVAGQTAGETSVLSDQPAEFGVRAEEETTVVGFPKHALEAMRAERHTRGDDPAARTFSEVLESLYVGRTVEAHLARLPALQDAGDAALEALCAVFDAERHDAGDVVLDAPDAPTTFALVRRGFVKEVRADGARETVANYLKAGDAFGGRDSRRRGTLRRFEAATKVEVLTARVEDLRALDVRFPGLASRLLDEARPARTGLSSDEAARLARASDLGVAPGREVLVIDTRLCVDCDNCASACERRHGHSRLDRTGSPQQIGPYQLPASCYHCDDPKCLLCAVEGIVREPTGEIRIEPDRCIGCGACAERCPYDNIDLVARAPRRRPLLERLVPDPVLRWLGLFRDEGVLPDPERVAVKCDLCVGHDDGPACVRACPVGAAARVDPLGLFAAVAGRSS